MAVHKILVQTTVLVEADTLSAARQEVEQLSPLQLAHEMDDGAYVGSSKVLSVETVPPERVREELLAVGNDGEFFVGWPEEEKG